MKTDAKTLLATLVLLLAVFSCFATAQTATELVSPYLEQGEALSFMQLDEQHSIIFVGKQMVFIVKQTDSSTSLVRGTYQITSLLNSYVSKNNMSTATLLPSEEEANSNLAVVRSFNASRTREIDCHYFIGPDDLPCTDKDSCLRSCYTPLCRGMLGVSNEGFLDAIKDFKTNTRVLNEQVASFEDNYPDITTLSEEQLLSFANVRLNELSAIEKSANALRQNKLFLQETSGGFYFCFSVDYNTTGIPELKSGLELLKTKSAIFSDSWSVASNIDSNTQARIDTLAGKQWCEEQKQLMQQNLQAFQANASPFQTISDVSFLSSNVENLNAAFNSECAQKKFSQANSTLEAFNRNLAEASDLLERVTARRQQFNSLLEQAKQRISELSSNSSINSTSLEELNSSVVQLETEFPLASNYSELSLLTASLTEKNVQLNALAGIKRAEQFASSTEHGGLQQFIVPGLILLVALGVAAVLLSRKGGGDRTYQYSPPQN
ncbi:hypothetical protein HY992_02435 [Candidatus Micrarchaeota archaeon]|nr:hypothetical protein [Candidatus Micrarchaeota archaeon]